MVARGEVRSHRRCRFQAAFLRLQSAEDVAPALAAVCSEKRIARATHPHIAAWRLSDGEVGYDDCGESGAGKRLLQLLERRGVVGGRSHRTHAATQSLLAAWHSISGLMTRGSPQEDGLVAVTRWYGGKPLGPARFRAISQVAKDLMAGLPPAERTGPTRRRKHTLAAAAAEAAAPAAEPQLHVVLVHPVIP
eukprot:COSAG01_NODE_24609_length_773_cov_0.891691_1_plen_191_part_01